MNSQLKQTPGGVPSIFKLVTIKRVPNQNAKTSKNNTNDNSDSATNILTPKININPKTENPISSASKTQIDATTTPTNIITTAPVVNPPVVIKRPKVFQSPTKKPPSPPSLTSSPYSSPEKEEPSTLAYHNNSQNMTVREQRASKNLNLYQNPTVALRVPKIIKPTLIKVGEKARDNYEEEKENNNSVLSTMPSQQKQESSVKDECDSVYVDRSFDFKIPNYYDQNKQRDHLKSSCKQETNNYKKQIESVFDKTVTRCRAKTVLSQSDDQKKQVTDYEAECQRKIKRMKEITKQIEDLGEELKVLLQDS